MARRMQVALLLLCVTSKQIIYSVLDQGFLHIHLHLHPHQRPFLTARPPLLYYLAPSHQVRLFNLELFLASVFPWQQF
jgi:hypothetical protein